MDDGGGMNLTSYDDVYMVFSVAIDIFQHHSLDRQPKIDHKQKCLLLFFYLLAIVKVVRG